jgi:hypothetical protein
MTRRTWLTATGVLTAIVLACWGLWTLFTHKVHVSWSNHLEAHFEVLPDDDTELRAWLRGQPGVVPHTVWTGRFGEDKKLLSVAFIQARNLAGRPPLPNLDAACKKLGYVNPDGPFHFPSEERTHTDY